MGAFFARRSVRYALVAMLSFTLGSATIVSAGPTISGFVGLIDGSNTARIDATGALSVADAGARQAFQHQVEETIPSGERRHSATVTSVPAGKILVIEHVSFFLLLPAGTGETPGTVGIITTAGGEGVVHFLQVEATTRDPDLWTASQPVRIYADPGTTVRYVVVRTPTSGDAFVDVTISGHFVDR